MRMKIIAGTGHRPKEFSFSYRENHPDCIAFKQKISKYLRENKKDIDYVITGMSIGYDFWLAEATLSLGIDLHAYLPFAGSEKKWPSHSQERYHKILRQCRFTKVVSDGGFSPKKMFLRNEEMCNTCDTLLAIWNPELQSGGTFSCIQYAKK